MAAFDDDSSDRSAPALSGAPPGPVAARQPAAAVASRYERRGLLGVGGMGKVTLVFDHQVGREVALKEVAAPEEGLRRALVARFTREARVTALLEHPGIVPVYDIGETPDGPYYTMRVVTMRVVRGRALSQVLAEAPTLEARLGLLRHFRDACEAVAFAHRRGVIHRDLKPANIMVGAFGETQVMDWGLAGPAGEVLGDPQASSDRTPPPDHEALWAAPPTQLTQAGAILGTPRYLSPDQAAGQRVDARADVFALGLALHELLSGRAASRQARDEGPRELQAIVRRATAPRPADRYADAGELAADLSAWLDGRRVGAHAYTNLELLGRLVRAWRAPLVTAAVAAVVGATGLGLAFRESRLQRETAESEAARAERERREAEDARQRADAANTQTQAALRRADSALASALGEQLVARRPALDRAGARGAGARGAAARRVARRPRRPGHAGRRAAAVFAARPPPAVFVGESVR